MQKVGLVGACSLSKSQIDKIGARLRDGQVDVDSIHALEAYRAEFAPSYARVEHMLRDVLGHAVTGRPAKSTISIIEKLRRQKTRLAQIQDIAGCRVVVGTVLEQDSLVETAKIMFPNVVVDDKRADPNNGYRAVHLIVNELGKIVEVQVRTQLQHFWAEFSEKMGDTYGHEIKYGSGNEWALDILAKASSLIRRIEELFAKRVRVESDTPRLRDKQAVRKSRKQVENIDLRIRHEFYKLRSLTRDIGA